MSGKVYLVGAGPGELELITKKAERLIKSADVIVFDRLVGKEILSLNSTAKMVDVGKNVGNHPIPQHQINQILVDEAMENGTVVRLKGGDPFIFGRGGEELQKLIENNIEFEVVPGITSSITAPMYAGIPVTHRDFTSSLHIITGHAKADEELNIDFESLVKLNGTLIFMMSVSSLGKISKGLISSGMDKDMPCAIIENGTRTNQRKFVSTIEKMPAYAKENKVISPSVFLVGKVASLSNEMDWFSNKPLKGEKILLTQRGKSSSKIYPRLKDNGAEISFCESVETKSTLPQNLNLDNYQAVVFSSEQGVASFFEWLDKENKDARHLFGKKIATIGSQTAKALKNYGISTDFTPSTFDGKTLAEEMVSSGFVSKSDNLLLVRPKEGSNEILETLANNQIKFEDVTFYETIFKDQPSINLEDYDYVTFTSKSGVENFVKGQKEIDKSKTIAICIGNQTAQSAISHGFNAARSDIATMDSMIDKILQITAEKRG